MRSGDLVGRPVGEFIIKERIGRGGMAEVYRAFQPSVSRDVALKIIHIDVDGEKADFRRRFAHEAEIVASLEHIHILPVYSYGIEGTLAYLAMRLLRGGSLSDMLRQGPLPMQRTVELFSQIARGLAYAHSKGVIHRDLKPSNILLDDSDNAYLTDFGLAKLITGDVDLTKSGNIVGTPAYMSPEQLRGEPLDHRSDIYSLGVVLYHMMTGAPPFDATMSDVVSVIYKHLEKAPEPPSKANPEISPEVEAVVLKALAKKPEERYNNAGEMANSLKKAMGLSTLTTPYPGVNPALKSHTTQKHVAIRKHPYILFTLIALLILLVVGAGALLLARSPAELPGKATVVANHWGAIDSAIPTADEIRLARLALGSDGFIAYLACNQTSEYHSTQAREMRDFAAQFGLAYRVYDGDNDKYKQLTQIENARTDGAKAIIICPLDPSLLDQALKSVQNAGMPLVILAANMPSYGGVLVEGDDFLMGLTAGRFAGQYIRDKLNNKANIVVLDYPDLPYLVQRTSGLISGVRELAPGAKIVAHAKGASRDFAKESVGKLIADGTKFDFILSINDAGSFGAIDAMEAAGIQPDQVPIVSIDAEVLAQQYISANHFMLGSLETGRRQFSTTAINVTTKLLAGATVPEKFSVPPGDVITKETLDKQPTEVVPTP